MVKRTLCLLVPFMLAMALFSQGMAANASPAHTSSRYADFLRRGYMVGDEANFDRMKQLAIDATERSNPGTYAAVAAATGHQPTADLSFEGAFDTSGEPPDTTGTIGPSRFVEAVNSRIDIYDQNGSHLGGATFDDALGPCVTTAAACEYSDPQVLWDQQSQRFYYEDLNADIGGSANFFVWGFSKNSSPDTFGSSDWCNYTTQNGAMNYGNVIPDYPKMGASTDYLMIGVNDYAGEAYTGSDIDTISKPQTNSAFTKCPGPHTFTYTRNGPISDCNPQGVFASDPNPAQQAETDPDGWVVANPDPSNSGFAANWVDVIHVTKGQGGKPVVGAAQCVSVPQYSPPPPAVQKADPPIPPYTNDTLDGRITHAVIAKDPRIEGAATHPALWTSHTVQGGAGSEVDWYEIDVVRAQTFQTGVVSDPNLFVYNGAISDDRNAATRKYGSDMVLGFSTSGTDAYPAIQMVSKRGGNPQSSFVLIKQSPGPNAGFSCSENPLFPGRCRWGDYSGAVPDPSSPKSGNVGRVWLANQWVTGEDGTLGEAEWRTWIWRATP
jgi:hypothetical protein